MIPRCSRWLLRLVVRQRCELIHVESKSERHGGHALVCATIIGLLEHQRLVIVELLIEVVSIALTRGTGIRRGQSRIALSPAICVVEDYV